MTTRDGRSEPGEAGFVLIGVVIFVLALTIIGIALFSLSSYEAQFLQRSIDREQAFQTAVGAIERAKFALTVPPYDLLSVTENLPAGVSTVAFQDQHGHRHSDGEVLWDPDSPILIRVTAGRAGAQRVVEASFRPIQTQSYYSKLITVSEGIEVVSTSSLAPTNRDQTVLLDGPIWDNENPNAWRLHLCPPQPDNILQSPAPVPDVAPYLDPSAPPLSTAPLALNAAPPGADPIYVFNASGPPGVPAYWTANNDPNANFSFTSSPHPHLTIQVHGLAVLLLPSGGMFYEKTEVTGNPATDCLVVIAGPMTGSSGGLVPPASICFLGYLRAYVPVILVSSGRVLVWHENDYEESSTTSDLAIFARSAKFMGPSATFSPRPFMELHRYPNGPLNSYFLDLLGSQGALPNAGGKRLDFWPGSWQASDQ